MKRFNWTPVLLMVAGAILWAIIRRVFLKIFRKKEKQQPTVYEAQVPPQRVDVKEESPIGFKPENLNKEESNDSVKVEETND